MLDANLKTQLQAYLERLTRPVHLVASLDDGDSSKEMLELLQDIEGLSPQVTAVQQHHRLAFRVAALFVVQLVAAVDLEGAGRVRFDLGIQAAHADSLRRKAPIVSGVPRAPRLSRDGARS